MNEPADLSGFFIWFTNKMESNILMEERGIQLKARHERRFLGIRLNDTATGEPPTSWGHGLSLFREKTPLQSRSATCWSPRSLRVLLLLML